MKFLSQDKYLEYVVAPIRKYGGSYAISQQGHHAYFPDKEQLAEFMKYVSGIEMQLIFPNGGNKVTDINHPIYANTAEDKEGQYHMVMKRRPSQEAIKMHVKATVDYPTYQNFDITESEPDKIITWMDVLK